MPLPKPHASHPRLARFLGWLGIALLALGTYRAFPRPTSTTPDAPALRAILLDCSAGTTRRRRSWGLWARRTLRDQALLARDRSEQLRVILYGDDVRRLRGDPDPEEWLARLEGEGGRTLHLRLEGDGAIGSELDRAIDLVEEDLLDPNRPAAALVLVGESDYTGPDPAPRLARLERGGVDLHLIPPPPPTYPDLALEALRLPRDPEEGAPLVGRLDLALDSGSRGLPALAERATLTARLIIDTAEGTETRDLALPFPTGPADDDRYHRWSVRVELGAARSGRGRLIVQVRLTGADAPRGGDQIPQNDTRSASWRTGGTRVVAAVARAESLPHLRSWLGEDPSRWPGLQWLFLEPERLGAVVSELDAVLSFDLSPRELPAAYLGALLDRGGGWLFCGGWGILAPWSGANAASPGLDLAAHLPIRPVDPEAPERDVLFLVDGSGSMAGEPFDRVKVALSELVAIVSQSDSLGLHFFTGTLGRRIDLDAREGRGQQVLRRLFATRVPGGMTEIFYSLERLVELRAESDRGALVILLSDGRDYNAFDTERRGREIRDALTGMGVRLRILAVGDDADLELLSTLLAPGEELVHAEDLSGLTDLFRREVLGDRVRHGEFDVIPGTGGSLEASRELFAAWREAGAALSTVEGYLRCEATEGADVLWRSSEEGEVLLAVRRAGGGLVAAWPTAPLPGWAPGYATADERLAPLLRTLARGARRSTAAHLEVIGDRLVLGAVPERWPARIVARVFAYLPGAPDARELLEEELAAVELFPPVHPLGLDPRSERSAPLPRELAKLPLGAPLRVELSSGGGTTLAHLPLEGPPPPEFSTAPKRLRPGPWASPGSAREARGAGSSARTDPDAWWWLLVGSLALFAGALWSSWWGESTRSEPGASRAR